MMVNYSYVLRDIEKAHGAYTSGKKVAAAPEIRSLLKS